MRSEVRIYFRNYEIKLVFWCAGSTQAVNSKEVVTNDSTRPANKLQAHFDRQRPSLVIGPVELSTRRCRNGSHRKKPQ